MLGFCLVNVLSSVAFSLPLSLSYPKKESWRAQGTAMAGGTDNNQLKWQQRHGGVGNSDGNSSRGHSNDCRGRANDCRGRANKYPGHWRRRNHLRHCRRRSSNCSVRSNICSERGKECLALRAGSSAHSAVLPPLVGGGACPTFPVGSRGGGSHDKRVVGAGCDGCVGGCACWFCVCCAPLLFC
jgi:hypothetical protein